MSQRPGRIELLFLQVFGVILLGLGIFLLVTGNIFNGDSYYPTGEYFIPKKDFLGWALQVGFDIFFGALAIFLSFAAKKIADEDR